MPVKKEKERERQTDRERERERERVRARERVQKDDQLQGELQRVFMRPPPRLQRNRWLRLGVLVSMALDGT